MKINKKSYKIIQNGDCHYNCNANALLFVYSFVANNITKNEIKKRLQVMAKN